MKPEKNHLKKMTAYCSINPFDSRKKNNKYKSHGLRKNKKLLKVYSNR